jgi:DNA modification methylase
MINLYHSDNIRMMEYLLREELKFDFLYADCVYENEDFTWLSVAICLLKQNGIFIVQTDYRTVADYKQILDDSPLTFVNWCIYLNDWGGTPKDRFAQKHDDILIYCDGKDWKWYADRIQIPKATAGTAFDKKGTGLKTPPSVFYDHASFSTMSNERVKLPDGKGIQWQKPIWLMKRLLLPFTDENDFVLDPFMGSGTLGVVCKKYNRNYFGIENNKDTYNLAKERINEQK